MDRRASRGRPEGNAALREERSARHLLELMDNQGMNVSYPAGSLARAWDQQIVGGSEDPLQLEFTAAGRRHASELAARYGKF